MKNYLVSIEFFYKISKENYFLTFRIIYILRILRLFRHFSYVKIIKRIIKKTFSTFFWVSFLLILVLFIFSLFGMELFMNKIKTDTFLGFEFNFESFPSAFLSCFNLITLNDWYDMIIIGYMSNYKIAFIVYTLFLVFIGNFIILNLFIALMLEGFENLDQYEIEEKEELENEIYQTLFKNIHPEEFDNNTSPRPERTSKRKKNTKFYNFINQKNKKSNYNINDTIVDDISDIDIEIKSKNKTSYFSKKTQRDDVSIISLYCKSSLFYLGKNNVFRKLCCRIMKNTYFNLMINFFILCSLILLSLETFFERTNKVAKGNLNTFAFIINLGFSFEAFVKIIYSWIYS